MEDVSLREGPGIREECPSLSDVLGEMIDYSIYLDDQVQYYIWLYGAIRWLLWLQ